jgi:putative MATE family efflux protein
LIVATILNAILDLIFVLVFKWGIVAVSWATVVSQAVACIGLVIYINKKHHFIKLKVFDLVFDKEIFKKSMLIGLPQGIQQTVVSMSMTLITSIVGSFGAATMAGFTVAIRIDSFAMMPIMNISMALTSFVGQNVGAGKYDRVKEALKASLILSLSISAVMGLIFIFAGDFLTGFFTKDLEVVRVGDDYLHIMGGFFVVLAAMFMLTGVLRGAGDSIIPMIISLTTLWGVRVPVSYLCSRDWTGFSIEHLYSFLSSMTWTKDGHDSGIWWGAPVSWVAGLILTYIYYKKGHWRNKSVVKKTNPD